MFEQGYELGHTLGGGEGQEGLRATVHGVTKSHTTWLLDTHTGQDPCYTSSGGRTALSF